MQNHLGHKGLCIQRQKCRPYVTLSRSGRPYRARLHVLDIFIFGRNWLKERKLGIYQQIIDLQVSKKNENSAILVKYPRGF